jgi:hypothetical protein
LLECILCCSWFRLGWLELLQGLHVYLGANGCHAGSTLDVQPWQKDKTSRPRCDMLWAQPARPPACMCA